MPIIREAVRAIGRRLASHPLLRRHPRTIVGGGVAVVAIVTVSLVAALAGSATPAKP